MCLSSRRNMCIHPKVSKLDDRAIVDSECRSLTASWVYSEDKDIENTGRCLFYDRFQQE